MFVYIVSFETEYFNEVREVKRGQLTKFRKTAKRNGWIIRSVEKVDCN